MSKPECPYCGEEVEICHDDGFGKEEGVAHTHECEYCEKNFVFYTSTIIDYEVVQADCLNGGAHQWGKPVRYWRTSDGMVFWGRQCKVCKLQEREINPEWSVTPANDCN